MTKRPRLSTWSVRDAASRFGALAGVLLLGLALRLNQLNEWWLSPDEGIYYSTLTYANFGAFWQEVVSNAHPPLYYLILRGLGTLTWDFFWFRMFSVMWGMAAIVAAWAAARELARGTVEHRPHERVGFDQDAALLAALVMAISPGAVALSQVIRPYAMLLSLLAGSLFLLLRYRNGGSGGTLLGYAGLVSLALLTHYSALLAFGVFGMLVLHEGTRQGIRNVRWQQMAMAQSIPCLVLFGLYLIHLRDLAGSSMADRALNIWLDQYMVHAPTDAWFAHLGFQSMVAIPWFIAPATIFTLGAIAWSSADRDRTIAVVAGGGLLIAVTIASLGLYPFGAPRHSSWLLAFIVPAIGWLGGRVVRSATIPGQRALFVGAVLLIFLGGKLGGIMGEPRAPWAHADRVLRESDLEQMMEVLDPTEGPELMVMSEQTYYLLMPLYPEEREAALPSSDGTFLLFDYGQRRILVSRAYNFAAGPDRTVDGHLSGILPRADEAFPDLGIRERTVLILAGGWRAPIVDELTAIDEHARIGPGEPGVPGLYAFEFDMHSLLTALGVSEEEP